MLDRYKIAEKNRYQHKKFDPSETSLAESKENAKKKMAENLVVINDLQQKLYADKKESIIFLFQAMDAAGKDGTIRAVLSCLSPHGLTEYAFKPPTAAELAHDYLWRVHQCVPEKGQIAIFNRSHYEDVLIVRVHGLYKKQPWAARIKQDNIIEKRFGEIRDFEKYLFDNSVRIIKIFLNVSKEEQGRRFLSRLTDSEKNWKFSATDMEERQYWDAYQEAYEDAINKTTTKDCPWYVVPADHKWYMRYIVSQIIRENLENMQPNYPTLDEEQMTGVALYRKTLEQECGANEE